jgi:uncharacterized protein
MLMSFCPHEIARRVEDIDLDRLKREGVRGLLLDLDNTLTLWQSEELSPTVRTWLERATQEFRVCLLSNAVKGGRVHRMAGRLGVSCVHGLGPWGKPWALAYRRALAETETAPGETVMIGDQLFTDICGARRSGMRAIMVEPMGPREFWVTKINRKLARRVEAFHRRRGDWPTEYCSPPSAPEETDHEA